MNRYLSCVWVMCVPVAVACNGSESREPVSAANMALTAQQNVERALRGAHAAGSFIADSATLAKLLSAGSSSCVTDAPPCAVGTTCATPEPTCTDAVTQEDLIETRSDMANAIDDLVKVMKEDVFTPENLESEDGQSAVYRLSPEFLCKGGSDVAAPAPTPGGSVPDTATSTLDPECVQHVSELQPRLRLTSPSDGNVDAALLLTAQKHNPLTLALRSDGVALQVDLGELKATLDSAHQNTGELASMSGKLEFELKRNAELDYSFRFNVLSSLSANIMDSLMQQVAYTLAGNKPSFEVRLDGNAHQVTGTYHFGAFGVKGPLNALYKTDADDPSAEPHTPYTGLIDLLLAGFDGSVTFDGNRDRINLTGVGLGNASSTLKHDGNLLAQLDINKNNGRHFDVSVERNADDQTTLSFSPTFDLDLLLNFASLKNQIADIPTYALSDRLRVFFDGPSPSVRAEPDQLRVISGTLKLESQSTPDANLSVAPGMCLLESDADTTAEPAHELLGSFSSGACQ
ncbi:MAG: hypothetical protein QM756_03625 [Polyangiaceae bacterium]